MGWYRLEAKQGDADAMSNLGFFYVEGRGVPQDYVQTHMWYNLAASRPRSEEWREEAVERRDNVAALMTPEQIAQTQRLARAWDAAHPREPRPRRIGYFWIGRRNW